MFLATRHKLIGLIHSFILLNFSFLVFKKKNKKKKNYDTERRVRILEEVNNTKHLKRSILYM